MRSLRCDGTTVVGNFLIHSVTMPAAFVSILIFNSCVYPFKGIESQAVLNMLHVNTGPILGVEERTQVFLYNTYLMGIFLYGIRKLILKHLYRL